MANFTMVFLVCMIILPALFAVALRYIKISNVFKKWIFTFLSTFIALVVMVPVPNMFILPMPHPILLVAVALNQTAGVGLAKIYTDFWQFNLVSLVVTLLVFRVLATWIFSKKPLPNLENKPI